MLAFFAVPVSSLRETLQESLGEGALERNFIAQFGGNDFTAYSRYLFEALKDPVSLFDFYPALKRSLASSYPSHDPSLDNLIDNTKYTLYLGSVLGGIFLLLVLFLLLFFLIQHLEKDEIFESSQDFSKAFKTAFLFNLLLIGMLLLLIFLRSWVSILLAVILYLLLPFFSLRHGFYQVSRHESIQIQDDSLLHDDVVVGPNSIVKGTLPSDSLYIRNKVLQEKEISEGEKNKALLTQALS